MSAAGNKITIAGICAAVAVAASQSQTIFEQLAKHFGSSPYFFFVQEIRYEAAIAMIAAILLYNMRTASFVTEYPRLRDNWRYGKIGLPNYKLHVEEWLAILTIFALAAAFSYHLFFKIMRTYQSYGLMYVSEKACEGNFGDAVGRIEILRGNQLWNKYRVSLNGAGDRYAYLNKIADWRLKQSQILLGRTPVEELLAQAVELQVIFGADVRQISMPPIPAGAPEILQDWKTFIDKRSCKVT